MAGTHRLDKKKFLNNGTAQHSWSPRWLARQLRAGELVRHALADMLTRGDAHDPVIEGHLITVPEVVSRRPAARDDLYDAAWRT